MMRLLRKHWFDLGGLMIAIWAAVKSLSSALIYPVSPPALKMAVADRIGMLVGDVAELVA